MFEEFTSSPKVKPPPSISPMPSPPITTVMSHDEAIKSININNNNNKPHILLLNAINSYTNYLNIPISPERKNNKNNIDNNNNINTHTYTNKTKTDILMREAAVALVQLKSDVLNERNYSNDLYQHTESLKKQFDYLNNHLNLLYTDVEENKNRVNKDRVQLLDQIMETSLLHTRDQMVSADFQGHTQRYIYNIQKQCDEKDDKIENLEKEVKGVENVTEKLIDELLHRDQKIQLLSKYAVMYADSQCALELSRRENEILNSTLIDATSSLNNSINIKSNIIENIIMSQNGIKEVIETALLSEKGYSMEQNICADDVSPYDKKIRNIKVLNKNIFNNNSQNNTQNFSNSQFNNYNKNNKNTHTHTFAHTHTQSFMNNTKHSYL
eukprot:GHVR01053401.1.p1 GENE.GHVR01053401.1~~GHVR01053401.1.p1  ORF type:complete len:383 (+),score=154.89 GHVR01053401.1:345-1493(+)